MREARLRVSVARHRGLTADDVITTWAGPGSGRLCSGCSRTIEFHEVECEVELPRDLRMGPLRFHADCYRIWSGEQATDE